MINDDAFVNASRHPARRGVQRRTKLKLNIIEAPLFIQLIHSKTKKSIFL